MRIPPDRHDGDGTNASLHAFLTDTGHPAPTSVSHFGRASASRDIASTVQRLRSRETERPLVDRVALHEGEPAKGIMIGAAILFAAYILVGILIAHFSGRMS